MKSGICPKCQSDQVYSGAAIALKKGPFGSNAVPISLTSIAALDNYICKACGYVESYIADADKLEEIADKWEPVGPSEKKPGTAED